MLTTLHGGNSHRGVPVPRRGNNNTIQIFLLQKILIILLPIFIDFRVRAFSIIIDRQCHSNHLFINIADNGNFHILSFECQLNMPLTPETCTNNAYSHFTVLTKTAQSNFWQ